MHESSMKFANICEPEKVKEVKGAVHMIQRIFPVLLEDQQTMNNVMWQEQAEFKNQINAPLLLEAISMLLLKPGFAVKEISQET